MLKNKLRILKNSQGMTLLEIMIVLVILGGIATVLVTNVTSSLKRAKIKQARIQIGEIGKSLDMYFTDCGQYPDSDAGLEALVQEPEDGSCTDWGPDPYVKRTPKDPWGNAFGYEADGGSFVLVSYGADRREGGSGESKDISSEDL